MSTNRIIHLSKMTGVAGSERHLLTLLPGLRAHGLDVYLWILVEPGNPVQSFVDQASALDIPTRRLVIHRHLDPGLWRRLASAFRDARPDIVHTHLLHADLYGIPAARRARVPYVVSSQHNDDQFRRKLPMRWLHRWLWSQTDRGIAISEAIRQFVIRFGSAPPERLVTIHYGLDPSTVPAPPDARAALRESLGLPGDCPVVGSVCRLAGQKGLLYGLRGFARIAPRFPQAHYVIAGDGPLRPRLETEAHRLGLAERVHFLGWRDDARAIIAGLDVLLAPSLWEGFGLVFLEAMALCVPVIGACVSAIPEIVIDGETGWLVPPRDPDAIGAALHEAFTDPPAARMRGANGRRRLEERFSPEMMVERTLALYRSLETSA